MIRNYYDFDFISPLIRNFTIPILIIIYLINSSKRSFLYLLALFFGFVSNLLISKQPEVFLFYAILFFVFYRVLTIIIVIVNTKKIRIFPVIIGMIPFLITLLYIIFLTSDALKENLYSAIASAFMVSFLAGLSITNYVMEDNIKNTWLLISSLLFVSLVFVYIIENYYIHDKVFTPIRSFCYSVGHFLFYRYIITHELSNKD